MQMLGLGFRVCVRRGYVSLRRVIGNGTFVGEGQGEGEGDRGQVMVCVGMTEDRRWCG